MNINTPNTLNNITVKREDLIRILKENLEAHNEVFNASTQAYYESLRSEVNAKIELAKKFIKILKDRAENITAANVTDNLGEFGYLQVFRTTKPISYSEDYESAIRKVELSVFETFTLTNQEFERYVLNNWEWKENFIANATQYSTGVFNISGANSMAIASGLQKFTKSRKG